MASTIRFLLLLSLLFSITHAVFTPDNNNNNNRGNANRRHINKLPPCPTICDCFTEKIKCDFTSRENGSGIDVSKDVQTIDFSGWSRKNIDVTFFENVRNLRWLRLAKGKLVTFPSWKGIDSLSYLDVSDNLITSLNLPIFSNNSYWKHLNVSGNRLINIGENFFSGLIQLRTLDLSRNPLLLQIPSNIFYTCCGNLQFLDLSFTGLTKISLNWTNHLQQLRHLNISHNDLISLPELNLPSLDIFDASYNNMTILPKLSGLRNLAELYLSHTSITFLNAEETKGCNKLKIIDISYANLTNINEHVLSNCKHFVEINLSHNLKLYRIEHGAFSGLVNLAVLRLNNCPQLDDMEETMFNGLESLRELHLQDSAIQVLPSSLGHLHNLSFVNLERTNLLCDCYSHWLPQLVNSNTNISSWKGINPIQCQDGSTKTLSELDLHLEDLSCDGVSSFTEPNQWVLAPWDQSALLECNVTGNPEPTIIWLTVDGGLLVYNKSVVDNHHWLNHHITEVLSAAKAPTEGKYQVLQSGQLLISNVKRKDIGRYKCFAFNAVSNTSVVTFLGLQDTEFRSMVLESMLFGISCAALFLFVTLLTQLIKFTMERLGWECCCCRDRMSPKAKQIKKLIDSVESYKSAQLDRLKENYNAQVLGIKEGCYSQMERLRDGYSTKSKNLKDLCDYSTQQLTGARDQYIDQVNKVRDYSMSQMGRVRENYVFQRQRIRKFSGHQLVRLRETYKYQQKTLNKLLETLPDLYIQNCRTGSCQRTDSMIFENEIDGLDIYYKVDFLDNTSDYYTPSSTLTRPSKSNKMNHSRNGSSVSGDTDEYQAAYAWIPIPAVIRRASTRSNEKIVPIHSRFHVRSSSLAAPPIPTNNAAPEEDCEQQQQNQKSPIGHKRSISASTHPSSHIISHAKTLVAEETLLRSQSSSSKSSQDTPLYITPLALTPVLDNVTMASTLSNVSPTNCDEDCAPPPSDDDCVPLPKVEIVDPSEKNEDTV